MPCGEITKKGRAILDHAALSLAFGPVDLRPVAKWTRGLWPCRPAPASWRVKQKKNLHQSCDKDEDGDEDGDGVGDDEDGDDDDDDDGDDDDADDDDDDADGDGW